MTYGEGRLEEVAALLGEGVTSPPAARATEASMTSRRETLAISALRLAIRLSAASR